MVKLINPAVAGVVASLALAALVLVVTTVFLVTAHNTCVLDSLVTHCCVYEAHARRCSPQFQSCCTRVRPNRLPSYVPTD